MKRNINLLKKALQYLTPFKRQIFFIMVLVFFERALTNFSGFFLGKSVDAGTNSNFQNLLYFLIAYVVVSEVLPILLSRFRYYYEIKTTQYKARQYVQRGSLLNSLQLSLGQIKKEHSGFKQDILRNGESAIGYFHDLITNQVLPIFATILVSVVGLYFINIQIFYVTIIFAIVFINYRSYMNRAIREPLKIQIKNQAEVSKTYVDILRSLFFIKFANQKKTATDLLVKFQDKHRIHAEKTWTDFHKRAIFSDLLFVIYYVVIAYLLYVGLKNQAFTTGMIFPIFSWITSFANSLQQIQNIQRRSVESFSQLEKMFEMLDQKSDLEVIENPRNISVFENKISFEHVAFDYLEGKKNALKTINFDIKKGEKVALVGRSGSGKTTIISLLLRLYDPTQGTLMVDRIDLKALELSDWHNLIAYVPQDGDLLDISIKENILFGAKHQVMDAELELVLEKAGIKEFIHSLPHGIDSTVGEKGVKLSGGQKQRVCIARALIKDAPILLLDEATSSLDSETETIVNKAIWDMLGDKTGVVIAHRLSTILDADKIIVMDHGEIIGIGTHKQLLKSTPYYKKLVDAQNVNL